LNAIFSISYFPPISYLQKFLQSEEVIIDQYEHFIKQTYRNRCYIYGPNGKQLLVIPVVHKNLFRTSMKDVRISYDSPWNKIHWKSICAAYRNSPFFEFYEEELEKIFLNPGEYLLEFNYELFQLILRFFKIEKEISFAHSYQKVYPDSEDLRNYFHPGNEAYLVEPYTQVFSDRHGFINDLSCMDLLFNLGKYESNPGSRAL
jgi:hypothetical protein